MDDFFEIVENKQSDIDLGVDVSRETLVEKSDSLQRTDLWQEERRGSWTGSRFKNCMQCDSAGGKLDWFNPLKVYKFSKGALKYIYENAKERETGRYIETKPTWEMKYGTKIEPLIERRANEFLKEKNLSLQLVGFKVFPQLATAGVSSDAIIKDEKGETVASAEFKACTSWSTHYDRTFEKTDDSSTDFWQTQGQMIAWEVTETYYFVISPPSDITKYLFAENIMDLYEDWVKETEMDFEIIKSSPIHHKSLLKRLEIMESTIQIFLELDKPNLKEILYEEIDHFKKIWDSEDSVFIETTETAEKSAQISEAIETKEIENKPAEVKETEPEPIKPREVNFSEDDIPF